MKDYAPDTKRNKRRVSSKLDVMCRQMTDGKKLEFWCMSTDVSELGVRIHTGYSLNPAKSVFLQVNIPYPKNAIVTAMGKIRWHEELKLKKDGTPEHAYGINFEEIDARSRETLFCYLSPRGDAEDARK